MMSKTRLNGILFLLAIGTVGGVALAGCSSTPTSSSQRSAVGATTGATTGTITFTGGAVALGVGYQWGSGVLTYGGVDYPFKATGISVVDVGAAKVSGTGRVSGLRKLSDFNGNYVAATAGAALAGGGSASVMRNQNGVTIDGISTSQGARLTFAPSGVDITLN
jgi:hypothetical protein